MYLRIGLGVIFFILYVMGMMGLMEAEEVIEQHGAVVPDLMGTFVTSEEVRSAIEKLGSVRGRYLSALWTWDVLFPVGYGGLLACVIRWPRLRAIPVAAMLCDFAENVSATRLLTGDTSWVTAFQVFHAMKWLGIFASAALAFISVVSYVGDLIRKK